MQATKYESLQAINYLVGSYKLKKNEKNQKKKKGFEPRKIISLVDTLLKSLLSQILQDVNLDHRTTDIQRYRMLE